MYAAGTVTVRVVVVPPVTCSAALFQVTVEADGIKLVPVTVSENCWPPTTTVLTDSDVIVGAGFVVTWNGSEFDEPPPAPV
jgi:hypothetical protein